MGEEVGLPVSCEHCDCCFPMEQKGKMDENVTKTGLVGRGMPKL
jgi:hypothetical protein